MDNAYATTAEQPVSKTKFEIVKEAKRIEESLLHSSKGHFAASSFWSHFHLAVGLPLVILSAVAGTAAVKNLDKNSAWAVGIPVAVAVLSAMITFLNPSKEAATHLKAGNEYDSLMNRTRIFWAIECSTDEPDNVMQSRLLDLSLEKDKLNKTSPQLPFWAFWSARKGIRRGEAEYLVDKPPPSLPGQ